MACIDPILILVDGLGMFRDADMEEPLPTLQASILLAPMDTGTLTHNPHLLRNRIRDLLPPDSIPAFLRPENDPVPLKPDP
jgi:hypothetical protein